MQTRGQKRTEKAIADHVGWVAIPLDIIEKIITHAVSGDKKDDEPAANWYAERVRKYGKVCPSWKRAIILSRTIFQPGPNFRPSKRLTICYGLGQHSSIMPAEFIQEGYLPAVKLLDLRFYSWDEPELRIQTIAKSLAEGNSIKYLALKTGHNTQLTTLRKLNAVLKRLTKADYFELDVWLHSQGQAKWVWELMRSIVHSNSRPKTIKFSSRSNVAPHDVASRGIIRGQAYDMIDWAFINDTERLNVGSIRQLIVKRGIVPIDFFNKLADIGTIRDRRH